MAKKYGGEWEEYVRTTPSTSGIWALMKFAVTSLA